MADVDDRPTGTPPPLLPGVMRLTIDYADSPTIAANVFHFLCHESGGLGASDVSGMAQALGEYWLNDVWKHIASASASSTEISATYALIEGEPNVKKVHIADAIAGVGTTSEPANVALLVLWDTGDPRRGGKPRTYIPYPADDEVSDTARVVGATITAVNGFLVTFLGHIAGHTVGNLVCDNLVEYSTVNNKAYRTTAATFPLTTGTLSPYVASQRRRVDRLRS